MKNQDRHCWVYCSMVMLGRTNGLLTRQQHRELGTKGNANPPKKLPPHYGKSPGGVVRGKKSSAAVRIFCFVFPNRPLFRRSYGVPSLLFLAFRCSILLASLTCVSYPEFLVIVVLMLLYLVLYIMIKAAHRGLLTLCFSITACRSLCGRYLRATSCWFR